MTAFVARCLKMFWYPVPHLQQVLTIGNHAVRPLQLHGFCLNAFCCVGSCVAIA